MVYSAPPQSPEGDGQANSRPGHRRARSSNAALPSASSSPPTMGAPTLTPIRTHLPRRKSGKRAFFLNEEDDSASADEEHADINPRDMFPNVTLAPTPSSEGIPFPSHTGGVVSPQRSSPPSRLTTPPPSLSRTSSSGIILSNGKPLKPSLKGASFTDLTGELRPHMRTKSEPSTPSIKSVHFRDEDDLEEVRVYNRTGRPANLLSKAGEETETETEAETAYPFPQALSGLDSAGSSAVPDSSTLMFDISPVSSKTSMVPSPTPDPYANIHVESVSLPRTRPAALRGTVLVRNMSFEKKVAVRFTFDEWQTTSEVFCKHVVSLPGLPQPFPRSRTVGGANRKLARRFSYDGHNAPVPHRDEDKEDPSCPSWDRFSFTIQLEDYATRLADKTLWLVARYNAPGVGEWWDNNGTANYRVGFRRVGAEQSAPVPSPLAGTPAVKSQQKTFTAPATLRTTPLSAEVTATHTAPLPVQVEKLAQSVPSDRRGSPRSSPHHSPRTSPRHSPEGSPNVSDGEAGRRRRNHPSSLGLGARPSLGRTMSSPPMFSPSATMGGLSPVLVRLARLNLSNYAAPAPHGRLGSFTEDDELADEAPPPPTPPRRINAPSAPTPMIRFSDASSTLVESPKPMTAVASPNPENIPAQVPSPAGSSRSSATSSPVLQTPTTASDEMLSSFPPTLAEDFKGPSPAATPRPRFRPSDFALPQRGSADSPFSPVGTPLLGLAGGTVGTGVMGMGRPTGPNGLLDTHHAEYAAFVRKWCFAQSPSPGGTPVGDVAPPPPPAGPSATPTPRVASLLSSPAITPPQIDRNAWLGMGEGYTVGVGIGEAGRA